MRVISKKVLEAKIAQHTECGRQARAWLSVVRKLHWTCLEDVRKYFRSADQVGPLLIFNLRGNRFRLIVRVSWQTERLFVKELLTHAEYDRKEWLRWLD
jgi:mRNA interferase HigB